MPYLWPRPQVGWLPPPYVARPAAGPPCLPYGGRASRTYRTGVSPAMAAALRAGCQPWRHPCRYVRWPHQPRAAAGAWWRCSLWPRHAAATASSRRAAPATSTRCATGSHTPRPQARRAAGYGRGARVAQPCCCAAGGGSQPPRLCGTARLLLCSRGGGSGHHPGACRADSLRVARPRPRRAVATRWPAAPGLATPRQQGRRPGLPAGRLPGVCRGTRDLPPHEPPPPRRPQLRARTAR